MSSRYHQSCAEVLRVPLWQYKMLLRTSLAQPSSTSCPHGDGSGHPRSLAGAAGKSWRRREGGRGEI